MTSAEHGTTPVKVDFHCHLDLYPDPHAVAAQAQTSQVAVLSVTTTPTAYEGTAALAHGRPMVRTALGLHPELAAERGHELPTFDRLIHRTAFVGEVGLDGSRRFTHTRAQQLEVFSHILRTCADAGGRILSVHSRGAVQAVLDAVRANPRAGTPVLHWYTGTMRQAESAMELGCWFSVGTQMLASPRGRDLIALVPPDRILTETDGPFSLEAGQPQLPGNVTKTTSQLARLWAVTNFEASFQVESNLRALLHGAKVFD